MIDLDVVVYENGLDATWDLVTGKLDLVLSPLITQIMYYAITGRLRIVAGGASGGAEVLENSRSRSHYATSTMSSTMDLCLAKALREGLVEFDDVIYENSGKDILRNAIRGNAKFAALWEPLASKAKLHGLRKVIECRDLGINYCCTLAARPEIDQKVIDKIVKCYSEAIELFTRDPTMWLSWYASIVSIDVDELKHGIRSYTFRGDVCFEEVKEMMKNVPIVVPSISAVKNAFRI